MRRDAKTLFIKTRYSTAENAPTARSPYVTPGM